MNAVTPLRGGKAAADKPMPVPVPDDRSALRSAVHAKVDAEHAVTKHRAVVERARARVADAEHALEKAQAAIEKASEAETATVARELRLGASAPKSPPQLVEQAIVFSMRTERAAEAARKALADLETELGELTQNIERCRAEILVAVTAIVIKPAEAALARARKAKADYLAARETVWALIEADKDAPTLADWSDEHRLRDAREEPVRELFADANRFFGSGLGTNAEEFSEMIAIKAAWREWRLQLRTDADAERPALPE